MALTLDGITALAPDQASLKAAHGLMKAKKWPVRAHGEALVWGECQGSGANPYRTVFDCTDHGYKCTCPSRKFPCKHVLALMWMHVEDPSPFAAAEVPGWVTDWLGRRRKTGGGAAAPASSEGKSLAAAKLAEPEAPLDPKAEARRKAATEKRARETEEALAAAVQDLERWISDQLRTGLSSLLAELGKLVLLIRAWQATPLDPELRRMVASAETRDSLLESAQALRVTAHWEVLGEQISTRRDGMVSQATWLVNLDDGSPGFALLLDFFPANLGKRASAFAPGEQFRAELVFYPARVPLRAVIAERSALEARLGWPKASAADPIAPFLAAQDTAPWLSRAPVLLPAGGFYRAGKALWWRSADAAHAFPLANAAGIAEVLRGIELDAAAGLWSGGRLTLLAGQSAAWGRVGFDA